MANLIRVIGIGPGNPEYIPPVVIELLRQADVLAGGERQLEAFSCLDKEHFVIKNNLAQLVEFIKIHRGEKQVAVLASGDPSFYGILEYLKKHFDKSELAVFPGISSAQLACARLCISWHDAVFFSYHGRAGGGLEDLVRNNPKVVVLTDPKRTPAVIARELTAARITGRKIYVCERLSYPDEQIGEYRIDDVPEDAGKNGCVVVITDE